MSLSLSLYVCLFAIIKTRSSNFPELLMMMPVARSTASQVGQQQNNTTTINFFPENGFKNMEDTAEKALAQYWDDVERSTLITTKERVVMASAHFFCTDKLYQEALLLQTDCTTRYIKQNLVNCCTIVGTRCTTNPYEIEVMQLEHCGRRTCVCV